MKGKCAETHVSCREIQAPSPRTMLIGSVPVYQSRHIDLRTGRRPHDEIDWNQTAVGTRLFLEVGTKLMSGSNRVVYAEAQTPINHTSSICARVRSMAGRLFPLVVLALAAASCVPVLGASATPPAVYLVGDAEGWTVPPGNAADSLNRWATAHRFHVGDVLDFKYSNDSVLLVRRADYDGCGTASPVSRFADGDTRFTLGRPGLFYFISGVPARCEAGQRMAVRVVDALRGGGSAPAPAPAPAPMVPSYDAPPSGDRLRPVWFKLLVPALLGFLGGCFFGGVLLAWSMNRSR